MIGISIVHYGEDSLLEDCLKTLPAEGNGYSIEIFDCNKVNLGFSRANNILIKEFLNEVPNPQQPLIDWVWLLNNDTKVVDGTLGAIRQVLPTLPKDVGVIGFKILSMANPDLIHHAGTVECVPSGIHKSGSVRLRQHVKRTAEKWVTFASVLIRREVFEQIGLLDEKMVNYYSDSDFCYRARYAGFKVIYEPTFVVLHKIGQSATPSPEQMKILMRDSFYFQNKYINGKMFHDLDKELVKL